MTALVLGAISTKGRPLRHLAEDVVLRRRHLHRNGGRCADVRDEPREESTPLTPPPAPAWMHGTEVDPALVDVNWTRDGGLL